MVDCVRTLAVAALEVCGRPGILEQSEAGRRFPGVPRSGRKGIEVVGIPWGTPPVATRPTA